MLVMVGAGLVPACMSIVGANCIRPQNRNTGKRYNRITTRVTPWTGLEPAPTSSSRRLAACVSRSNFVLSDNTRTRTSARAFRQRERHFDGVILLLGHSFLFSETCLSESDMIFAHSRTMFPNVSFFSQSTYPPKG